MEIGSKNLVKSSLELLRFLFRSEINRFSDWAIQLLTKKFNSTEDVDITRKVLSVIEEVLSEKANLLYFVNFVKYEKLFLNI